MKVINNIIEWAGTDRAIICTGYFFTQATQASLR